MIRLCFAFQLSSHPYQCTCEIRKQFDNNFLSSNPKYEKNKIKIIFMGSWGPLRRTQGYQIFRAVRPHHRADICIPRKDYILNISGFYFFAVSHKLIGPSIRFNEDKIMFLSGFQSATQLLHSP